MSERRLDLSVSADAAGRRLDQWLSEAVDDVSRARIQRLLDAGQVLVDGRRRAKSHRLAGEERETVDLAGPQPPPGPLPAEAAIRWEDEHLLVLDKPAGLVVHPAPGHRSLTLVDQLTRYADGLWRPHVVHRLDKNTSGLMVVAKGAPVKAHLQNAIRQREVSREYIALVKGRLDARSGTIDAPIGRDLRNRTRMSTRTAKARPARTHFEVESFLDGYTLVCATLETGRTHQIRAHFAATGTPVCGDPEYGAGGLLGLERQFLHSRRLAFTHPETAQAVDERSGLPDDLATALRRAEDLAS
jgi:23S rRNA pseudouridine1911/1915/1917 synthase